MSQHITIEELKTICEDNGKSNVSEPALVKAVDEINGRVDNFMDALIEDIFNEF